MCVCVCASRIKLKSNKTCQTLLVWNNIYSHNIATINWYNICLQSKHKLCNMHAINKIRNLLPRFFLNMLKGSCWLKEVGKRWLRRKGGPKRERRSGGTTKTGGKVSERVTSRGGTTRHLISYVSPAMIRRVIYKGKTNPRPRVPCPALSFRKAPGLSSEPWEHITSTCQATTAIVPDKNVESPRLIRWVRLTSRAPPDNCFAPIPISRWRIIFGKC